MNTNFPIRGMSRRIVGVGLAFVMAAFTARADDIILNGDFADGKTHWHGDGDAPDIGGRLVVTLKPDKWTVVSQSFTAEGTTLKLKITYALSSDCTLGKTGDKPVPPLTPEGLEEACGLENGGVHLIVLRNELFAALVLADGWVHAQRFVFDSGRRSEPANADGSHTFTAPIVSWNGFNEASLCLCFPPGQGTVTLTAVALTPPGP
jgi:hypothetical protein